MKIDLVRLAANLQSAQTFELPELNQGTAYLHDNIITRLLNGEMVHLSDLDFDAFDAEDIDALSNLYDGFYEKTSAQAVNILHSLRRADPISKVAAYV